MTCIPVTVLVVAKAPEPGKAKTRLAATVGDQIAADLAAAALLDTLDAVATAPVETRVVALTGNLDTASRGSEIRTRLESFVVVGQRGADFAERLSAAHADAGAVGGGLPVLQIGMDTPQVSAELLAECARRLVEVPALLGPAVDGGWWILGVRDPTAAHCLRGVPMSQPNTGDLTLRALGDSGIAVTLVQTLTDLDIVDDIGAVRAACSTTSRFAEVTRNAGL